MKSKEEQIRELQKEIRAEQSHLPCGKQRDLVVYINHSLDEYSIELVQQIEKYLDDALGKVGLTRSTTHKGDIQEFVYWQYAQAI